MINDKNLRNQYEESKQIIRQAMDNHQLVLFVGAGASIASGMPTWGAAIRVIADRLSINDEQLDYLRIPQYYFNARGKKEYTQLMREIFRHGDYLVKNEIHDKIIEFDAETIITTNYDHLIEQAAEDNGRILSIVSKDADLPYRRGGRELIKMHGDFENDNFVLKEDDYLAYSRNFKLIENYVKSLIGTKVVLFIGYSFNDPDLKLIFSWVKDILGGDFQRAYLIESGKAYDVNEAEYFKNFGINLLYASVQLQEKYGKGTLTDNLSWMLKWLLEADEPDKLARLYNELRPFKSMNYASRKYVNNALRNAGIWVDNGTLTIDDLIENSDDETKFIFKSLAYEQWIRMGKNIELSEKLMPEGFEPKSDDEITKKCEENNKRAEEYFKDFKPDQAKQKFIGQILDVLCKSNIICLEAHLPQKKSAARWLRVFIPLSGMDRPGWIKYMDEFNFDELEKIAKENGEHLSVICPELYMEQGYIQFILGNTLAAYNCYKNAKGVYYKRQEYAKCFIAEFNCHIIGKTITASNGYFRGVDPDEAETIKDEMKSISLDKMFNSLPDLGESNKVLKDLYTFNVAYTLFQDAYKSFEKVNEQAETKYFVFSGTAAFAGMRQDIFDYYRYISLNYLSVDDYIEHLSIFRIYFQSIVNSVMVTDDVEDDGSIRTAVSIHESELQPFDLLVALKFVDIKNIEKILKNIAFELPISGNAIEYLTTVIGNCNDRMPRMIYVFDNIFWKCISILGHCNLSLTLVDIALQKLNEMTQGVDYRNHSNKIIAFVGNAQKQKMISDKGIEAIEHFVSEELGYIAKEKKEAEFNQNLTKNLLWVLKENEKTYDKVEYIKPLIADESKIFVASIYKLLGEKSKGAIYAAYSHWAFTKGSRGFEFYYYLVDNEIIKPSADAEKNIFEHYGRLETGKTDVADLGIVMFPVQNENEFLYKLLNLYIKDLILDKDSYCQLIMEHGMSDAEWIIKYKDYDYSSFDIKWLNICSDTLISDICKDKDVKGKIKKSIEMKYKEGDVSQRILDIYFKYMT